MTTVGSKLPNVEIDTSKYNPTFVKMMMLIGLMTATKLTMSGLKAIASRKTFKSPNKKEMQVKYGLNVWALVVDAARNEDYCVYLAKQGINLILMGE